MKKEKSIQALDLKDAFFLIASIIGIVVDLTILLDKSNGIISFSILLLILIYYFGRPFMRQRKKRKDRKHKLVFITPGGNRRTDLIVEAFFGRKSTSNGGCVTVDQNVDGFSEKEYEIWIFLKGGKFLKTETIVRSNNEPVVIVEV